MRENHLDPPGTSSEPEPGPGLINDDKAARGFHPEDRTLPDLQGRAPDSLYLDRRSEPGFLRAFDIFGSSVDRPANTVMAQRIDRLRATKVFIIGLAFALVRYLLVGISGVIGYLSGVVQDGALVILIAAGDVIAYSLLYRWYGAVNEALRVALEQVSADREGP